MITQKHWDEWVIGSGVDPDLVALNIQSLSGESALQTLLYAAIPDGGHNRYYLTNAAKRLFDSYEFATKGGWWVSGVDPFNNWGRMEWGQFKPDSPRPDLDRPGRFRKYESPKETKARAILLFVPDSIAERIYQKYEVQPTQEDHALGFWYIIWKYNLPIIITEGAKKAACLLTRGYAAIALIGITMGVRTKDEQGMFCIPHLVPDLEHFATAEREVYVCFDHETKERTIRDVEREIEKLKVQFAKAKCKFKVVVLPGPEKGVDDFIVAQGADTFHQCYENALSFELWQAQRYSRLNQPADLELDQRYLGKLPIPADAKLVAIKSPKGTGKTESFVDIAEEATQNGQRVLLITHRIQLGQAICDRIGLPYVSEIRTSEEGALLGFGVCIDSLYPESQARFNAENWHDAIVIVDECEQVFLHLLESTTEVSTRRMPILAQFKQLLINTLESDRGRIILSDADLSNLSLECVWGLAEQRIKPWVVVNHYKPDEPWTVNHYTQTTPEQCVAALDEEIRSGGKPFVFTQSQTASARWSTTTLEAWVKSRHPDKRVLRIDSKTVADPTHEAYGCTSRLNEILSHYDVVVVSPVIETGVSIDLKGHFTSVWALLNGVSPENSARQALARVREAVPRHIWVKKYGLGRVANGSTSTRSILKAEHETSRVATKLLQIHSFNEELMASYGSTLNLWAKMAARINASTICYREAIIYGLNAEGHHIIEASYEQTGDVLESITAVRDEQHEAECEAIAGAENITPKEYEELKTKKAKTRQDQHKERKHNIKDRYQVEEVTPDLVAKDDDGWYPKLRLYYFLTFGRQFLQERDRQVIEQTTATGGGWLPTLNRSQLTTKVAALEALGVRRLIDLDAEFNGGTKKLDYENAHPELLKLSKLAKRNARQIKDHLGVTISAAMSPIQVAQVLLGKLGLKLTCDRQQGAAGCRERVYRYIPPKDGREEILQGWFTRDQSRSESEMHTPGIYIQIPQQMGGAA